MMPVLRTPSESCVRSVPLERAVQTIGLTIEWFESWFNFEGCCQATILYRGCRAYAAAPEALVIVLSYSALRRNDNSLMTTFGWRLVARKGRPTTGIHQISSTQVRTRTCCTLRMFIRTHSFAQLENSKPLS